MPIEPTPIAGDARVTLRLKEVHASEIPETLGKSEWTFAVSVNGLERWRNETPISVARGASAAVAGEIPIEIDASTTRLTVAVKAREHDALGVHQLAEGEAHLYRVGAFERDRGFGVEIRGEGSALELRFAVDVAPAT